MYSVHLSAPPYHMTPSDLKDLLEPPTNNRKLIKPNQSAVAYSNMIRGLAEIKTA